MKTPLLRLLFLLSLTLNVAAARAGDWLSLVDDDLPVCRLSIPGTHDACTGDGFLPRDSALAAKIATTQDLGIAEQWSCGVRAFDLRPDVRVGGDTPCTLQIYHGEFATTMTLGRVLELLRDSLAAHPTEFAVIILQHERSPRRDGGRWAEMTDSVLARHSDVILDFRPDITVGQLRGRLLVMSRDTYGDMPRGAYVSGWSFSPDIRTDTTAAIRGCVHEGRLIVQDFYDMTQEGGMPAKLSAIERTLRLSCSRRLMEDMPHTWFVNHTSGYLYTTDEYGPRRVSLTEGYRANAAETNRWFANLIESDEVRTDRRGRDASRQRDRRKTCAGIVMMDFAGVARSGGHEVCGDRLVKAVIGANFTTRGAR